jgi:hypothetical protein
VDDDDGGSYVAIDGGDSNGSGDNDGYGDGNGDDDG